jgi:hypothetical protein
MKRRRRRKDSSVENIINGNEEKSQCGKLF